MILNEPASLFSDVAAKVPFRILVVDDRPDQIEEVKHKLEQAHFEVMTADSREVAFAKFREYTVDIALIDIKLCEDEPQNRDGLFVAERIHTLAPEARVIFISRSSSLDIGTLLQMFNRNPALNYGRLAEAYVEKSNPEAVATMCQVILGAKNGEELRVPIRAKAATWEDIKHDLNTKVSSIMKRRNVDFIDGERQCIQILRRLASDDLMPLKEIAIERLGRGRSRTVVLTMAAQYSPTDDERWTVVKIGDREIVEAERVNFIKWVPGFVRFASYPSMTGAAASRQLAGIGYSMVGDANEAAKTFVDQFWDMQEEDSLKILDEVFHSLLLPKRSPRIARGSTLRQIYDIRFRQLNDTNVLADDLVKFCKNCGISAKADAWTIPIGRGSRTLPRPTDIVDSDFFGTYWMSVVHGDLHGENILVSRDERTLTSKTFLIDFAHIGDHHVFLDYIVMEMSVRMHLLKFLLTRVSPSSVAGYITSWVQCEEWLASDSNDRGGSGQCEVHGGKEELARMVRLVLWLRHSAWLTGFNDTYHNYYGALGMACLTSPYLPDDSVDQVRYGLRLALLSCAALSLERSQQDKTKRPLDEDMASSESVDRFLAELLATSRSRIEQAAKHELQALFRELPEPLLRLALQSGLDIHTSLQNEVPIFSKALGHDGAFASLICPLTPPERSIVTDLVVAVHLLDTVVHVRIQPLKDRLNNWRHLAFSRKDASG